MSSNNIFNRSQYVKETKVPLVEVEGWWSQTILFHLYWPLANLKNTSLEYLLAVFLVLDVLLFKAVQVLTHMGSWISGCSFTVACFLSSKWNFRRLQGYSEALVMKYFIWIVFFLCLTLVALELGFNAYVSKILILGL